MNIGLEFFPIIIYIGIVVGRFCLDAIPKGFQFIEKKFVLASAANQFCSCDCSSSDREIPLNLAMIISHGRLLFMFDGILRFQLLRHKK